MSDLQTANIELANINNSIRQIRISKREHEARVNDYEDHLKHLPDDEDVQRLLNAERETLEKAESEIKRLVFEAADIRKAIEDITTEQYRMDLEEEIAELHFDIPAQDPIVHCLMLSALAENLQYQYVSGKPFFHRLINRVYMRTDEHGNDKGYTDQDALNPEINYDDLAKIDEMRAKRRHIQCLRIAVEREFNQAMEHWPPDTSFTPKLLRRTDEEMEAYLDGLAAKRANKRKATARQVTEAEHKMAEQEDRVYTGQPTKRTGATA